MEVLKDVIRQYRKRPIEFWGDLAGVLSLFGICYLGLVAASIMEGV
jgi:hypothetical protein|tara:strand:- start:412 stop:549 length:138 start_codon:yes stop_codon:yes gene_type:complete